MQTHPVQFIRRGQVVSLDGLAPTTTLLQALRDHQGCTGTKEGCGEGDCGACTVVVGELNDDQITYKAINSCIRTAHSINGLALWTVEDLTTDPLIEPLVETIAGFVPTTPQLHPVQQAMVQCHASQCGFCTPGFVMSLFALYQSHLATGTPVTRELAQEVLSGNLCRCTGYRPILDAAVIMGELPEQRVNELHLKPLLQRLSLSLESAHRSTTDNGSRYWQPTELADLLDIRRHHPEAQLVAGCTDVGLWITKLHKQWQYILDLTEVRDIKRVEVYPHHIAIGAAVRLEEAFTALEKYHPDLHLFFSRFAGLPVRNSGTLGGNIANGSPIGDSMPLLIAMGANVVLSRMNQGKVRHRELGLEDLYTGYRTNVMRPDEILTWIKIPKPIQGDFVRAYKISKRHDDDISAVCLALSLRIENGFVKQLSIGAGGVAATPQRAIQTESLVKGQPWSEATATLAAQALTQEFQPISDMRASSGYRRQVLGNLMKRFWLESQGQTNVSLDSLSLEELA